MAKQALLAAKQQGKDVAKVGMIVKLVCVTLFILGAFGVYSFLSMLYSEKDRLAPVVTTPTEE